MSMATRKATNPTHATTRLAMTATFLFVLCQTALAQNAPPPVCPVIKRENPDEFIMKRDIPTCPDRVQVHDPIQALIHCVQDVGTSVSCMAFPEEVPEDPGDGIVLPGSHLTYQWTVTMDSQVYNYLPSYISIASFNCTPQQWMTVSVRVLNGSASNIGSVSMTCPQATY